MSYTPEIFNRFNQLVEASRSAVSRQIQYLLKPDDGYPKGSDARLKELYNMWRADCRAMDAACEEHVHLASRHEMIEMPLDDAEHFLCRRMAAVVIERYVFGEFNAQYYLPELVEQIKASQCHTHPSSCACHHLKDWTYANQDLLNTLAAHYLEKAACCTGRNGCSGCVGGAPGGSVSTAPGGSVSTAPGGGPLSLEPSEGGGPEGCTCGGCEYGSCNTNARPVAPPVASPVAPPVPPAVPLRRADEHIAECACIACYQKRVANGTQEAYLAKLRAETDAVLARTSGRYMNTYSSMAGARVVSAEMSSGGFGANSCTLDPSNLSMLLGAATRADNAISTARNMPGGSSDDGFAKNLFQTVQGVKYDDKCPHSLPFYACMSCSH